MGIALALLGFFWLTRDLSPGTLLLLCFGFFLTVAVLGAWEGGRRITPYSPKEEAQIMADKVAATRLSGYLWLGGLLVLGLYSALLIVFPALTAGWPR